MQQGDPRVGMLNNSATVKFYRPVCPVLQLVINNSKCARRKDLTPEAKLLVTILLLCKAHALLHLVNRQQLRDLPEDPEGKAVRRQSRKM